MQSHLSTAGMYTDLSGLAKLRAQASNQSPEANREVARQFEALFLQTMLKAMRQASQLSESIDGEQTRFYQDMHDKQIALDLARNGGVGLAAVIERQLGGGTAMKLQTPVSAPPSITPNPPGASETVQWKPDTPQAFIQDLWPHARVSAKELGVSADVLIAQAALETGWGRNIIHDQHGVNSYNLFGIKAGSHWQGEQVTVSTIEYRDGIAQRESAAFRSYTSLQQSMNDYVEFLRQNPRYQPALDKADDAGEFLQELQRAGYATDPAYADKIRDIMRRESFTRVVNELYRAEGLTAAQSA